MINLNSLKLSIFIVVVLLAGCRSGIVLLSPPLNAVVVDSNTGKPIGAVQVVMSSPEDSSATITGTTDQSGSIHLPPLKGTLRIAFPFVIDRIEQAAIGQFIAEGYVTKTIRSDKDRSLFEGAKMVQLVRKTPERKN